MKAIICGGRDFIDHVWAFRRLDKIHARVPITLVIEGGARGADRIARAWATTLSIPVQTFQAEWEKHGNRAGFLRNTKMANERPDVVIHMPGGGGTKMMVDIAKLRYIKTIALLNVR